MERVRARSSSEIRLDDWTGSAVTARPPHARPRGARRRRPGTRTATVASTSSSPVTTRTCCTSTSGRRVVPGGFGEDAAPRSPHRCSSTSTTTAIADLFCSANGTQVLLENRDGCVRRRVGEARRRRDQVDRVHRRGRRHQSRPHSRPLRHRVQQLRPRSRRRAGTPRTTDCPISCSSATETAPTPKARARSSASPARTAGATPHNSSTSTSDGWLDLYVANDFGAGNALYMRRGDTFVDEAKERGVWDGGYGMGVDFADYDNDGVLDLYVTKMSSTAGNRLLDRTGEIGRLRALASGNTLYKRQARQGALPMHVRRARSRRAGPGAAASSTSTTTDSSSTSTRPTATCPARPRRTREARSGARSWHRRRTRRTRSVGSCWSTSRTSRRDTPSRAMSATRCGCSATDASSTSPACRARTRSATGARRCSGIPTTTATPTSSCARCTGPRRSTSATASGRSGRRCGSRFRARAAARTRSGRWFGSRATSASRRR